MALNDYPYNDKAELLVSTIREETAWGGCLDGEGNDWWYYLEVDHKEDEDTGLLKSVASTETIWAAEYTDIGTVTYDPGLNTLTISLRGGWSLRDISEPVKIQGYNKIPKRSPKVELLNSYRGKETSIEVPPHRYYVLHLDVQLGL